jgi:hypothetical protein
MLHGLEHQLHPAAGAAMHGNGLGGNRHALFQRFQGQTVPPFLCHPPQSAGRMRQHQRGIFRTAAFPMINGNGCPWLAINRQWPIMWPPSP